MEAVGNEVIIALLIPVLAVGGLIAYHFREIKDYLRVQMDPNVRIQENEEERRRREAHVNDLSCSICLEQPKVNPVSSTCGHSFCAQCIFSLHNQHHSKIKCPLCRQQMNILFKLFEGNDGTREIQQQLRDYNMRFDDNRSILRRIIELPYVLLNMRRYIFSTQFLVYFLRSVQIFRMFFIIIVYLLLPFDLIPENVVGIIGYIDDFLIAILILGLFVAFIAAEFMRNRH